jgi:peptidoglycan hydrolase CwlO-like protein
MGSSWDFEDIQNIVTTINLYSLYYERYDNAKNNIDKFVKQISNINTKDIEKSFKILGESDNNIGKLTESIKDLTGKISELKFTY